MHPCAIFILDSNEFRAAGYATLLMPLACRSEAELHVALRLSDLENLPAYEFVACFYCVGGLSLHDQEVVHTLASLQESLPHQALIALSDLCNNQEIAAAVEIGLRGFLPTTMPTHVALAAIQFILAGGTYVPHSAEALQRRTLAHSSAASGPPVGTPRLMRPTEQPWCAAREAETQASDETAPVGLLRQRHIEVLTALSQGHPNKVIARQLNLTEATVKLYVRQLMKIFHAENRTQLALQAFNHPQVKKLAPPTADEFSGLKRVGLAGG